MNLHHLLVPIAPEQAINETLHHAFRFADMHGLHVTLLSVIEDLAEFKDIHRHTGTTLDMLDKALKVYQSQLVQQQQELAQRYPHIVFDTKIRVGVPYIEMIKAASDTQADMIVIDSHRGNKQAPCQQGSNTLNLMRKSEVPIWSISTTLTPIQNVLVAIDLTNQEYQDFNATLVSLAIAFCASIGAELTLCHAWRLESEGFLRKWSGYQDIDIALLSKKMRQERTERMEALLQPHATSTVNKQVCLLEGEARDCLPQYINDHDVDLVILGSLSRTGIAGFLMGNTAESILNQIHCSVITLKPESFHSPVLPS
ncbi:universal stress protein [Photobacterium aphoticum]|uniref:Universal stress protein family 1 n=1 Tax=Photobacterium aphoticum TaxID=754436 RepID=A0A0J1GRP9_9GAMM|nr:universal stress protein [Photobacterium aphoticum]KLV02346.1 Universal stress protein family 1 [Photobacterium aphoticum]PSU57292.1 universal stress protein [Photobacterium aphoticum]GHA36704.1 hypothetical protein GCM10007086_07410 [Photobacterium aphoticum]